MSQRLTEFLIGLLFGVGLLLSGMTDPGKVIGFLDLAGNWDPSLAFVMGGAILVGIFAFAFAKRRTTDFFGGAIRWPTSNAIDRRLVIGSVVFGAGWGVGRILSRSGTRVIGCWRASGDRLRRRHARGHGDFRVSRASAIVVTLRPQSSNK